jgi:hypothetical protein
MFGLAARAGENNAIWFSGRSPEIKEPRHEKAGAFFCLVAARLREGHSCTLHSRSEIIVAYFSTSVFNYYQFSDNIKE